MLLAESFYSEFDPDFYRSQSLRLALYNSEALRRHYEKHGRLEGRQASPAALRTGFVPMFEHMRPILEIGPFDRPMVEGEEVYYFDVLDQKGLIDKAEQAGRKGRVPQIHFVSPNGDLSIVDRKFRAVCSAHCIEHQPDLIEHLKNVARVLDDKGYYFIAAPDKRYSFDHFIPHSTLADVISAHERGDKVHTIENVLRHFGLSTHNIAPQHWNGIHKKPGYEKNIHTRLQNALEIYNSSNGSYIDVHAWRFTPQVFKGLIESLYRMKLIPFKAVRVYETPKPRVEFMAILQKAI